jgi:hypothetical protein
LSGASVDDALAALSLDLPSWYIYNVQQRHGPDMKGPPWLVRLQHRDGALLTPGTGASFARALWSAIEGAKAVERGRAVARTEPAPRFLPTQDSETACL